MPGPLNYTTKIAAHTTLAEVQSMLAEHGADAIAITYADRRPTGVRFQYQGNAFSLPANVDAMHKVIQAAVQRGLRSGHQPRATLESRDHAERVTWRVIKDWLEAQLALITAQQVTLDEVMLPYLVTPDGRTLREGWQDRLAIEAGGSV